MNFQKILLSLCAIALLSETVLGVPQDCARMTLYGDFIYWKAAQEQMEYSATGSVSLEGLITALRSGVDPMNSGIAVNASLYEPKFNFNSGFRLGGLFQFPSSEWSLDLRWTRFHQNQRTKMGVPSTSQNPLDQPILVPITVPLSYLLIALDKSGQEPHLDTLAESHWNLDFDTIDLELGKHWDVSQCIKAKHFLGLEFAGIRQQQTITYSGFAIEGEPVSTHNIKKNTFHGVGPSLGVDGSWQFCRSLGLSVGASFALLYGNFDVKEHAATDLDGDPQNSAVPPSYLHLNYKNRKSSRLRPKMDFMVGFMYYLPEVCGVESAMEIAYEAQYWWNQWQCPTSVESGLLTGNAAQGDLMLYGLTVRLFSTF